MTEKKIDSLVSDIYEVLDKGVEIDEGLADRFGRNLSDIIRDRLHPSQREPRGTLRMSNIGKPCDRQLWYSINIPGEGERLEPYVRMKFLFGDLLEEVLLFLTEVAGHRVEGRQDEQEICGIKGHRDAVIDGTTTDVKSASTYSFAKFEEGLQEDSDAFGYSDQLQSYLESGQKDAVVTDKERAAFLVVDKTLGHICLDIHEKKDIPFEAYYEYKKGMVADPDPPSRGFDAVPDGASGNLKLGTECSYCEFKRLCWPNLRVFAYSNGPRFLTTVKKIPNVLEIT